MEEKMKSTVMRISIAIVAMMLGWGTVQAGEVGLAARVNGGGITLARLQSSVDASMRQGSMNYGGMTQPSQYKRVQRRVLEQLIAQELLWQEAKRQGFIAPPAEVDKALEQVRKRHPSEQAYLQKLEGNGFTEDTYREDLKRHISVRHWVEETFAKGITVSDDEIHDYYVANQPRFVRPEEINVRHVLIKVDSRADDAAVAAARKKIEQVLAEEKQGADLSELAKKYSQGPSAPRGGELGFLPRGRLVKPFEDAAFALKAGEISNIVRTRYGFHIIKLDARRAKSVVPEEQAAPSIRNYLSSQKVQEAVQDRIGTLRKKGTVEIYLPS
jgi:peptidyl-prolyl cis-trans isomerase C